MKIERSQCADHDLRFMIGEEMEGRDDVREPVGTGSPQRVFGGKIEPIAIGWFEWELARAVG